MMRMTIWCRCVLFCAAAAALSCGLSGPDPADLIFHNARVWTADDRLPEAQAVAAREGRIIAVGTDSEILRHRGAATRSIDLQGAFLMPGFNDNHVHFASAARFLEFNVMRTADQADFERRLRETLHGLEEGEWILGGFWGAYDQWAEGSSGGHARASFTPDISAVEDLTSRHPLFIRRFDESLFAANRAALVAVGLDPENPQAAQVDFLKDEAGHFQGLFRGPGVRELFKGVVPQSFSRARRFKQTLNALEEIRRNGVVNVSDMSDETQLDIYRELRRRGELTVRIHYRHPLEAWQDLAKQGIRVGAGDDWIRLGSLKGHIDGIMGTSSARFFEPYSNDPTNRGRWRRLMVNDAGEFVEGQFLKYMLDADLAGLQLSVHAIGDEANSLLLDYLEELNRINGPRDRRFRLVHAQVIAPGDFKRLGELGVIAEVQPFHLSDDMRWMEERIGHERCAGAYAFASIRDKGGLLSFGTDWPGTSAAEYPINPLGGIYAAVTRRTLSGEPEGGWFPQQSISVEEALKAYTYNSAYANFEEASKGSITVGKLADLTVLDRDLREIDPRQILEAQVLFTVVDGRVVYEK